MNYILLFNILYLYIKFKKKYLESFLNISSKIRF